ncbi:DUF6461 domain-containing protein [Streptomyces sp. NBC_01506]|uniref:DUF6461 domain-containing protein n=1 Tax=Streptomyces sp. NBC_01506 TaxID=2903887 RepID=UPI00386C2C52
MSTTTAQDYTWLEERFPGLTEANCVTLIHGLPPDALLRRLGATEETRFVGVDRHGKDPDGLVPVMREVGFDLSEDEDRDFRLHTEAAFALAERVTGVRITPELLDTSAFVGALVRLP